MIIHTVQPGDTIYSIAANYHVPYHRLEDDNNLPPNYNLNTGQSLMITYPDQSYIVKDGDTFSAIANQFGVPLRTLFRNNPNLMHRGLSIGDELIISYPDAKKKIKVNGYSSTYINQEILKKTLPNLSFITITGYKVNALGDVDYINDTEIIQLSKTYGVIPILFISSLTEQGKGSYGTTHNILIHKDIQVKLIENIVAVMKLKGYLGLNLAFYNILPEDLPLYVKFIQTVSARIHYEGYYLFVSMTPFTFSFRKDAPYPYPYYEEIGKAADYVNLITYLWNTATLPQVSETTVDFLKYYVEYAITQIPPEKIFLGLNRIAYDWELPYVDGSTVSNSLTTASAITLANQLGVEIFFDSATQTPYFYYNDTGIRHYVWFKDARSVDSVLKLVTEYNLTGISVWNIMFYSSQIWLVIHSQFDIETIDHIQ